MKFLLGLALGLSLMTPVVVYQTRTIRSIGLSAKFIGNEYKILAYKYADLLQVCTGNDIHVSLDNARGVK